MLLQFFKQINEIYSKPNTRLLQYMKDKPKPKLHELDSTVFGRWLADNPEYIKEVMAIVNKMYNLNYDKRELLMSFEDYSINMNFLYYLNPKLKQFLSDNLLDLINIYNNSLSPTWTMMNLTKDNLIQRNTWLVHFTGYADDIAQSGFTEGVDDISKLGLTTSLENDYKNQGGYNFAFEMDYYYVRSRQHIVQLYGRQAVVFQNSGISAFHTGDKDNQIMFWGSDVDPRSMIVLKYGKNGKYYQGNMFSYGEDEPYEYEDEDEYDDDEDESDGGDDNGEEEKWNVMIHPTKRDIKYKKNEIFSGDYAQVTNWIKNNWRQYSKLIMGY